MNSNESKTFSRSYSRFGRRRVSRLDRVINAAPMLVTGVGFVLFSVLLPSNYSSKTEARIFTQGLSIQIDRTSPAYAALEDTLSENTQSLNELTEAREIAKAPAQTLAPVAAAEPVALKIARENRREDSLLRQERLQRWLNAESAQVAMAHTDVVASASSEAVINHPVQKISSAELAQLFAPLIKAPKNPPVPSTFGNSRAIASAPPAPSAPAVVHAANAARGLVADAGKVSAMSTPSSSASCLDNKNQSLRQVVISGPLQFSGGIAITSANDRVVVYREDEEDKKEPAAVWLKDARYEIFVDQPVGRLIGELRTSSGEVLGRGFIDLACLPALDSKQYRVADVSMTINPVPRGISGKVQTAPVASQANPKAKIVPVRGANVELGQLPYSVVSQKDGHFAEESLVEGSLVVAHADRPGHWGTMAFARVGQSVELPMFSDQTIRSMMLAAAGNDQGNSNRSFIWGRITRNGRPAAGAKVDLMTSAKEMKPVYFNSMALPDPSLTTTSENGLYAFFPLDPGTHAVQATDGHGVTEPHLIPTDEQTVTQANLELAVDHQAKVRVYDAFKTDWPLQAEVTSAGRKRGVIVPKSGEKNVTFTGGDGLLVLDADAGSSYDRVRVVATKQERRLDFPMVQSIWLSSIRGAMRINQAPQSGTIVGFVRGADTYRVSLEEASLNPSTRIVYFDAKGEVSHLPYGQRGGGFVIFNMPTGFRTVLVQPSGAGKAMARAVLVENSVTNVISKSF